MFKCLQFNKAYSFNLNGDYLLDDVLFRNPNDGSFLLLEINGQNHWFERKRLGLICHYEISSSVGDLSNVTFVECSSKVIGLKCGMLMVFTKPVEYGEDFFIIPGFTNFVINKAGTVKSILYDRTLKPSIGPYGYPYVNVYDPDKSRWRSINLHILLARTFIKNPDPATKFFVNHKDGNKQNFKIDNLEWVTSLENQRHAVDNGLRQDNIPCKIYDTVTKAVFIAASVGSALELMGMKSKSKKIVRKVGNEIIPILFLGRYEIHFLDDKSDWYYANPNNIKKTRKSTGPFQAKNISSGEVFEGNTITELSEKTNTSKHSVESAVRSANVRSVNGFLFRMKSEQDWPTSYVATEYTKPRKIRLTNTLTKEVFVFDSIRQTCAYLGIDKRTLKSRLKSNKPYGWIFVDEIE